VTQLRRKLNLHKLFKIASLEYSEEDSRVESRESLYKLFNLDNNVKNLIQEVELLDEETMQAYESNSPDAENLDAKFIERKNRLEYMMDELGLQGESNTGASDVEWNQHSGDLDELSSELASFYHNYLKYKNEKHIGYRYGFSLDSKDDVAKHLRGIISNYGYRFGGLNSKTTDEQILDAAKDSYERRKSLRRIREIPG
jgi:hypothetical protein